MNYEGQVTSLNPIMMTFQVDNKLTVHTVHTVASTDENRLPEIGEQVKIYRAHFLINSTNKLEKLFICDRGKVVSEYYTATDESTFVELVSEYYLGCSDVQAIDTNIPVIDRQIKGISQNSGEEIMFDIVRELADINKNKNKHKCLNSILGPLSIKTVSDYCYVDLNPNREEKMPIWFIGSHSKDKKDKLLGFLQINKRYGILLLRDLNGVKPCVVVNCNKINLIDFVNKFVVIKEYRFFTEVYREDGVPSLEYVLFDFRDVFVLPNIYHNNIESVQQLLVQKFPENFPYVSKFKFKLLRKATVNINNHSQIECWLDVLLVDKKQQIYLGLNAYQVQIVPLLIEGHVYEIYHSEILINCVNIELARIKPQPVLKFQEKRTIFVHISDELSNGSELENCNWVSVQGVVKLKKLTPALSSRTKCNYSMKEFGTPGSYTHSLLLKLEKDDATLYLNNWENLQMPLGLIPGMKIRVKNVVSHKNYFKSTAFTSFELVLYEPPVFFDTVNLSRSLERGCDKYSYLGWGDLIPCNVLVWARVSVLFVRSLKINFTCNCFKSDCNCPICTTLTFYVHDEFGAALVLCKSTEVLRFILDLEPEQWKIWCKAFKEVQEYTYNDFELTTSGNLFCEALNLSIKAGNACKISNLELKCRKLDNNSEDNNGMPLWFCIEARKKEFSI